MSEFPKSSKGLFGPLSDQRSFGDLETDELNQQYDDQPLAEELTPDVLERELAHASGVEAELEDHDPDFQPEHDIQPFDPTKIRIITERISLDNILKRITHHEINLQPDFQRMGGIWDKLKMSRLIESLLIRIPLPAFYMDASDEDEWLVIDGLQRLTTFKRFIIPDNENERLRLYKMEFWKEYEGFSFDELPRPLQRRIEETQVTLYLVQKGTPHNVKFNIFKRINTGGVPLSGQEIRHALNLGAVTDLLKELAETEEFKQATDNGVSPMRMTDRECVLRFLAFVMKHPSDYTSKDELDSFLNNRMKELNELGERQTEKLDDLRNRFVRAMKAAQNILGRTAFRKPSTTNRRSPISKALFEVWSVNFDRLTDKELNDLAQHKADLQKRFEGLMDDTEFVTAISYSTGDYRRVQYRFQKIEQIIQEILDNA